ncbi:MAG TPA: hypothetical protein VMG12_11960 [Polyangiaceae bacterium]|nr:hypothetical protein [Polyangiaceae bacterium]
MDDERENDVVEHAISEWHGSSVTLDAYRASFLEVTEHGGAHVEYRHVVLVHEVRPSAHPQSPDTQDSAAEVRLELSSSEEMPWFLLAGSVLGCSVVPRRLLVPEATHVIIRTCHFDAG